MFLKVCGYTVDEFGSLSTAFLKEELKAHGHPKTKTIPGTKKQFDIEIRRKELLDHYRFIHQNFGEIILEEKKLCYCLKTYQENDKMIGCDFRNCQKEWFHFSCLDEKNYKYPSDDLIDYGN